MSTNLEDELERRIGRRLTLQELADSVVVSGEIDSDASRQGAIAALRALAPGKQIVDKLAVDGDAQQVEPGDHRGDPLGSFGLGGMDDKWSGNELEENFGDEALLDTVIHLLREDPSTSHLDLTVKVEHARVSITGTVASAAEAANVERAVRQGPNVIDIDNRLTVRA